MPEIGEIRKAKELGYNNNNTQKYIWSACADCGKERWVGLLRGKPRNLKCGSCGEKGRDGANLGKFGKDSCSWKSGKNKDSHGYIQAITILERENKRLKLKIKKLEERGKNNELFKGK